MELPRASSTSFMSVPVSAVNELFFGAAMSADVLRRFCRVADRDRADGAELLRHAERLAERAYVESFGGCVREELLSVELFSCLAEAQVLIEDWRQDYNHRRPHSALGMMTPAAFAVG